MKNFLKRTSIYLLFASLMLFSACVKDLGCIEGNGYPIGESRNVSDFNEIQCNGSFEVRVYPSDTYEVIVDGESNLIPYIRTSVYGNVLYIETQDRVCLNNTLPVYITVYAPDPDGFELNGSGSIDASGLYVDDLRLKINGSGDITINADALSVLAYISGSGSITLSGIADQSDFNISGSGSIYAYQMPQLRCYANISGSGNMYVSVEDELDARISGSGTIYYRGNPVIYQNITGSGRLIKQ